MIRAIMVIPVWKGGYNFSYVWQFVVNGEIIASSNVYFHFDWQARKQAILHFDVLCKFYTVCEESE